MGRELCIAAAIEASAVPIRSASTYPPPGVAFPIYTTMTAAYAAVAVNVSLLRAPVPKDTNKLKRYVATDTVPNLAPRDVLNVMMTMGVRNMVAARAAMTQMLNRFTIGEFA